MRILTKKQKSEQGLTLVESLVAIVMITIAGTAIFPAIAITAATRVQNQRAELAMQVAEAEVNRVRLLIERGDVAVATLTTQLPPQNTSYTTPNSVPAPSGTTSTKIYGESTCQGLTSVTDWCIVEHPVSGDPILGIQTFRVGTRTNTNNLPLSLTMGVRVYNISALSAGSLQSPPTNSATLGLTSNANNFDTSVGGRRPLVMMYVPIVRSDYAGNNSGISSLRNFCEIEEARTGTGNCTQN